MIYGMRDHIGGAAVVIVIGGGKNLGHGSLLRPSFRRFKVAQDSNIAPIKNMLQCSNYGGMVRLRPMISRGWPDRP